MCVSEGENDPLKINFYVKSIKIIYNGKVLLLIYEKETATTPTFQSSAYHYLLYLIFLIIL